MKKLIILFAIVMSGCTANRDALLRHNASRQGAETVFTTTIHSISKIPEGRLQEMRGKSLPSDALINIDELRLVEVWHWGFDGKVHSGELVVHETVAKEVAEIFKELFSLKYQIEKIRLIDAYDADDEMSMSDNNSSAFCWRNATNLSALSYHALGLGIDINPKYNPYAKGDDVQPKGSGIYLDRTQKVRGLINDDSDPAVRVFEKYGWVWGGRWKEKHGLVDYQHFEKPNRLVWEYYQDLKNNAAH